MKAEIELKGKKRSCDLSKGIDISIPMHAAPGHLAAWYVDPIRIEPVRSENFVGSVAEGGSVNFRDIHFNPHGHGTHTECVGHITKEIYSVNQEIKQYFLYAQLISLRPEELNGDAIITSKQIEAVLDKEIDALVLRSLPNPENKKDMMYSGTNPPYLQKEALELLCSVGIKHLLLDLPSVDREVDGGALSGHRAFWNTAGSMRKDASITELIYVPNHVEDGHYLLNLQFPPFENDASPSRPLLFKLD